MVSTYIRTLIEPKNCISNALNKAQLARSCFLKPKIACKFSLKMKRRHCRPKVVKQLRFDARKKLESGSARRRPKEVVTSHSEAKNEEKSANYPQITSKK